MNFIAELAAKLDCDDNHRFELLNAWFRQLKKNIISQVAIMDQTSPGDRRMVRRLKNVNHVRVVTIGWLLGLVLAAIFLPPPDLGLRPASGVVKSVLVFLAVWVTYTAVAVPLYLYRAWLRARVVPNKLEYMLWVGFETLCAVVFAGGIAYLLLGR